MPSNESGEVMGGGGNKGAVVAFVIFTAFSVVLNLQYYVKLIMREPIPFGDVYFMGFSLVLLSSLLAIVLGMSIDSVGYRNGSASLRKIGLLYMAIGLFMIALYTSVDFAIKYESLSQLLRIAGLAILPMGYASCIAFIGAYSHRIALETRYASRR